MKFIEIDNLMFDYNNPRLPSNLQGCEKEEIIIDYMVKFGNIIELMNSIVENGYFEAEPLLVVPLKGDIYKVVEGNRRLAAVKLLNNPSLTSLRVDTIKKLRESMRGEQLSTVPCIVYEAEKDIIDYLGFRHITGVKDWGALEKARYLDQLYQQHINEVDQTGIYSKLAKMIGSRSDYVCKLHTAFKLYKIANDAAYYDLNIKEGDVDFSWITTALGYNAIREYLGFTDKTYSMEKFDEKSFKKVFMWLFDTEKKVVGESRQISTLAKVIGSNSAKEKLENGANLDEAILYTTEPNEFFVNLLIESKEKMQQALMAIGQLSDAPIEAEDLLKDIDKIRKSIKGALIVNFELPEQNNISELSQNEIRMIKNWIKQINNEED